MPPKMLTSTAFTLASERISLKASATRAAVVPPPTSRKFAGRPPCSCTRSMVAIASPAPFTMHPMLAVQRDVVEVVLFRLGLPLVLLGHVPQGEEVECR